MDKADKMHVEAIAAVPLDDRRLKRRNNFLFYSLVALGLLAIILTSVFFVAPGLFFGGADYRYTRSGACDFPPDFGCSSWKMNPDGSLGLQLGQSRGHNINITQMSCTQQVELSSSLDALSNPVLLDNGEVDWVVGGTSGNRVFCKNSAGVPLTGCVVGDFYSGKIWVVYTERDTGVNRTVIGDITVKCEN